MKVLVEKNVEAAMRDGTVLRADVYRPADDGRHPVIVQRTPYNKEFAAIHALTLDPVRAASMGLAVVIQDVRARWASARATACARSAGTTRSTWSRTSPSPAWARCSTP